MPNIPSESKNSEKKKPLPLQTIDEVITALEQVNPQDKKCAPKIVKIIERASLIETSPAVDEQMYGMLRPYFRPPYVLDLRIAVRATSTQSKKRGVLRRVFLMIRKNLRPRIEEMGLAWPELGNAGSLSDYVKEQLCNVSDPSKKIEIAAVLYLWAICDGRLAAETDVELAVLQHLAEGKQKKKARATSEFFAVLESKTPAALAEKLWRVPAPIVAKHEDLIRRFNEAARVMNALQQQIDYLDSRRMGLEVEQANLLSQKHEQSVAHARVETELLECRGALERLDCFVRIETQSIRNGLLERISKAVEHESAGIDITLKSLPEEKAALIARRIDNIHELLMDLRRATR